MWNLGEKGVIERMGWAGLGGAGLGLLLGGYIEPHIRTPTRNFDAFAGEAGAADICFSSRQTLVITVACLGDTAKWLNCP